MDRLPFYIALGMFALGWIALVLNVHTIAEWARREMKLLDEEEKEKK